MTPEKVLQGLVAIAARCGQTLTEWELEIYMEELEPLGWDRVLPVLRAVYLDLKGRGNMPSVNEIKSKLGAAPLADDTEALDVASRVLGAVAKYGDQRMNGEFRARAYVGEVGWLSAERMFGGWPQLCETYTYKNHPQVFAQLRDLVETVLAKARRGELDRPAALPAAEGGRVNKLIESAANALPAIKGYGRDGNDGDEK